MIFFKGFLKFFSSNPFLNFMSLFILFSYCIYYSRNRTFFIQNFDESSFYLKERHLMLKQKEHFDICNIIQFGMIY